MSAASDVRLNTERPGEKFRKKPVVVDAIQWTGIESLDALAAFVGPRIDPPLMDEHDPGIVWIWVEKSNARCAVIAGGWVIAEPDGVGFYPCTEEQFDATYEPAEDAVPASGGDAERLRTALTKIDEAARSGLAHDMARYEAAGACIAIQSIVRAALARSVPSPPADGLTILKQGSEVDYSGHDRWSVICGGLTREDAWAVADFLGLERDAEAGGRRRSLLPIMAPRPEGATPQHEGKP